MADLIRDLARPADPDDPEIRAARDFLAALGDPSIIDTAWTPSADPEPVDEFGSVRLTRPVGYLVEFANRYRSEARIWLHFRARAADPGIDATNQPYDLTISVETQGHDPETGEHIQGFTEEDVLGSHPTRDHALSAAQAAALAACTAIPTWDGLTAPDADFHWIFL